MAIPFISGEKVILSVLEGEDFSGPYLLGINDQNLDSFTDHALFPKTKDSLVAYAAQKRQNGDLWLGIYNKASRAHIGNIELSRASSVHQTATFAILLWSDHGQGLAFEASRIILEFGFRKLNLSRVELEVHSENAPAIALYKKLGFVEEGRKRQAFHRSGKKSDLIVMGLLQSEFR